LNSEGTCPLSGPVNSGSARIAHVDCSEMRVAPVNQNQSSARQSRSNLCESWAPDIALAFLTVCACLMAGCSGFATASKAPVIVDQPSSQQIVVGQIARFGVNALGPGPMSYQWEKNGASIAGATSMSYVTSPTTAADDGAQVNVVVSNSWGCTSSLPATLTVRPAGQLNASVSKLSFGKVAIGSSSTLPVTLSASGGSGVTISSVGISGPGFDVSGLPAGLTLSPGESAKLQVTFSPAAAGNATGSVPILSNASGPPATISLSGSGVQPVSYSVVLNWAETSTSVVGYRVYRSTTSGGPYGEIESSVNPTTTFTDTNVQAGQRYYYVLTSVNSGGVESKYSSEVAATIP
jgi:hypothetical protein